jgi:hypothetical protein
MVALLAVALAQESVVLSTGVAGPPGGLVLEQDLWATHPVELRADGALALVSELWVGFDHWSEQRLDLLSVGLAPGLQLSDGRWWLLAQPGVMLLGEPKGLGRRHVQGMGTLLAGHVRPSGPTWMLGAMGATALDGAWVVPLVGVDVRLAQHVALFVLLPSEVSLRAGDRIQGGVDLTLEGWSYARGGSEAWLREYGRTLPGYVRGVGVVRARVRGPLGVGLHGGWDVGRHLEERPAGRDDLGPLGPTPCAGLDLVWRAPTP